MTDANGNVVWRADYKPFGEEQSITGSVENNDKFVGKEKDKETGLYYFGARYMDAKTGRFVSVDPKGISEKDLLNPQRLNRYNYSLNNPYRYIDPDGKWPKEVHNTIISRAFSGGNYKLSPKIIAAMQRGSSEADSTKYQDTRHSYMHAMRAEGQDAGDAAGLAVTFITQKMTEYKTLMNEGKTEKAYEALGMAMHPLMDATSPSHEGMQEWKLIPLINLLGFYSPPLAA
jgi:RHS repeat-associated protein